MLGFQKIGGEKEEDLDHFAGWIVLKQGVKHVWSLPSALITAEVLGCVLYKSGGIPPPVL